MSKIYCGNNRNDPDVVVGIKRIGTRYACMKRGIGIGMNLPFDPTYAQAYDPIDPTRIYCGNNDQHPDDYDRLGSPSSCLRKGVGVGKVIKAKKHRKRTSPRRKRRRKSKKKKKKKRGGKN